jgi:hypothetical protein
MFPFLHIFFTPALIPPFGRDAYARMLTHGGGCAPREGVSIKGGIGQGVKKVSENKKEKKNQI